MLFVDFVLFFSLLSLLYTRETATATETLYDLDSNSDSAITLWPWVIHVLSSSSSTNEGQTLHRFCEGLGYIIRARDRTLASA